MTPKHKKRPSVFRQVRERLQLVGEGGRYQFWLLLKPYGYPRHKVYELDESAEKIHPKRLYHLWKVSGLPAEDILEMCNPEDSQE